MEHQSVAMHAERHLPVPVELKARAQVRNGNQIAIGFQEVAPSQAMEMGQIMPEVSS